MRPLEHFFFLREIAERQIALVLDLPDRLRQLLTARHELQDLVVDVRQLSPELFDGHEITSHSTLHRGCRQDQIPSSQ